MIIKIKSHDPELQMPAYIEGGDWIDLRCAEDTIMKQGDYRLISLGVSMDLPGKYEAHILPRSSTFKNFGIIMTNGMGIIDNSYCGNNDIWRFPAYATRDTKIEKGDRIAQFRVVRKQKEVNFLQVEDLDRPDRGGIGSTGRK